MIQGETGTGKELFAQSIHNFSPRHKEKYVAVNCAAIPEYLMEGLLFGTRRGAFTGALDKPGLFETAHKGTLFLDELLTMPMELQAKLLRVIQEKQVRRLGSVKEIPLDVKIISSVNRDPRMAIRENRLRTDLYYRLGVVMVKLPPAGPAGQHRRTDRPFHRKIQPAPGDPCKGYIPGGPGTVSDLSMARQYPGTGTSH